MESTSTGIVAARQIAARLEGRDEIPPPPSTMMGALLRYITESHPDTFQPMNANFGLLDPPERKVPKAQKKAFYAQRALNLMHERLELPQSA
jgi:methylenetetrahydrofolate--tRNA-(uracil-5-)-methyltransferase